MERRLSKSAIRDSQYLVRTKATGATSWALDVSELHTGTRASWDKIAPVSQAQFETAHGSIEQDFDGKEAVSPPDTREWKINNTVRVIKQSIRLRIHDAGPISIVLKPRSGAKPPPLS